MPIDPGDPAPEAPCLAELLAERGLAHWLGALTELCARQQGWLADYECEPDMDPDFRPMSDILAAVSRVPVNHHRPESALACALGHADFLARAALDRLEGAVRWDPFEESYRHFAKRFPSRHPYWSSIPSRIEEHLVQWMRDCLPPAAQSG